MRSTTLSRPKCPERLTATVDLGGQRFSFRLFTRRLQLGDFGTIDYYWMDTSEFHDLAPERSAANFRNCLGLWKAAMQDCGLWNDLEEQANYLLAACYPLVCRNKSLQKVFRDAFLDSRPRNYTADGLSEESIHRIHHVVAARDRSLLKQELDRVLDRSDVPALLLPAFQKAFRQWVGKGVFMMSQYGQDGLDQFLSELKSWLNRYRKKGGNDQLRQFITMFAYEAKVSFYTCFANAWVALVPWLKEHHALDQLSERFLSLWHYQNQPIEIPHGRTVGGLYYPTQVQATALHLTSQNVPVRQAITWRTPPIGPQFIPDVFSGQILSLHPLSGFFMKDPPLCAIAGRFLTSSSFEAVMSRGRSENHPLYWDLVGAILTAAHSYRNALDCQAQNRGVRLRGGDAAKSLACQPVPGESSAAILLEDFATVQGICCPQCGAELCLEAWSPAAQNSDRSQVRYRCRTCRRVVQTTIERSSFEDWLLQRD